MDTTPAFTPARRRSIAAVAAALLLALIAPLLVAAPAGASGGPGDGPRLRAVLRCHGSVADDGAPSVVCNWRARTAGAAEIVLVRVTRSGDERGAAEVVARFDDLTTQRHVDAEVEFGTLYRYRVILLDEDGQRIGRSRVNRAVVVENRPEIIAMTCDADGTEPASVTCSWRAASDPDTATYRLWRKVRGEGRVLVAETEADITSAADVLPDGVTTARYGLIARDADGDVIARSRVIRVG